MSERQHDDGLPDEVWALARSWAIGDDGERGDALAKATTEELEILLETVRTHFDAIMSAIEREGDSDLFWLPEAAAEAIWELTHRARRERRSS